MALQGVTLHLTAPGLQHLLRFPAFEVAKNFLLCSGCLFFLKKKKVSSTVSVFSVIPDYISVKSKKQM